MAKGKKIILYLIIFIIPLISIIISLCVGRFNIFQGGLLYFLKGNDIIATNVFLKTRLPRTVVTFLVGGILAMSGCVLQGIFRNPLVSPDIIGISMGATLGTTVAIVVLNFPMYLIQVTAFVGGIISVGIVIYISHISKSKNITNIVIAGMLVNSICQAGITFLKYKADPLNKLPSLEYWLMGSFNKVRTSHMWVLIPIATVSLIVLYLLRWQINILSIGDEDATYLGLNVNKVRIIIILIVTFIISIAVSISGNIGWIGLLAPHIVRILFGNNSDKNIPTSFFLGGSIMLIADTFSRTIVSSEIPISVVTSIIGAPVLIYLLLKVGNESWN